MTVSLLFDGSIELAGDCPIEDAEKLQCCLLEHPGAAVDWRTCTTAHTAVIQVLLAVAATPIGPPQGEFLRKHMDSLQNA